MSLRYFALEPKCIPFEDTRLYALNRTGTGASACLRIAIQMECNEVYCVYLYFSRYALSLSLYLSRSVAAIFSTSF